MLVFVDLLMICSSSMIVFYFLWVFYGSWRVSFWTRLGCEIFFCSIECVMTLLHGDFAFFAPPQSFFDFLQSGNSKSFICGWDYDLLKFVFYFVNLGQVQVLFLSRWVEALRFLDILASLFFLFSILVDGNLDLWWYCPHRWFLWVSGRCRINLLKFPF